MAWTPPYTFVNGTNADADEVNATFTAAYTQALADARVSAPSTTVASLPASPTDGQVAYYQTTAMATAGVMWQFRYRSASASTHKWEFVGGGRWFDKSAAGASGITGGGAYAAPSDTDGPSLTLPLAGEYIIEYGMTVDTDAVANSTAWMTPKIGSAAAADNDAVRVVGGIPPGGSSAWGGSVARTKDITVAASDLVQMYYKGTGGHTIFNRWMAVAPVRVS